MLSRAEAIAPGLARLVHNVHSRPTVYDRCLVEPVTLAYEPLQRARKRLTMTFILSDGQGCLQRFCAAESGHAVSPLSYRERA